MIGQEGEKKKNEQTDEQQDERARKKKNERTNKRQDERARGH